MAELTEKDAERDIEDAAKFRSIDTKMEQHIVDDDLKLKEIQNKIKISGPRSLESHEELMEERLEARLELLRELKEQNNG